MWAPPISQLVTLLKTRRSSIFRSLTLLILLSALFHFGKPCLLKVYREKLLRSGTVSNLQNKTSEDCNFKINCIPDGSEALPKGIITHTSNLEMITLSETRNEEKSEREMSLLAIAAGAKHKEIVNKVIKKFPHSHFALMLFHYDGIMDEWKTYEWNSHAIHVSALNQSRHFSFATYKGKGTNHLGQRWFAKRFLYPDVVSAYSYIFVWDEDFGVDHFNPIRYLSIVQKEGLQISQPSLYPQHAFHYPTTIRKLNSTVHRLFIEPVSPKFHKGRIKLVKPRICNGNTKPPCAGFVEMMAPVFSRSSWRCVWHMIQNDLVHGWGLDHRFGYCAQGNHIQNVGIVDAEYISHIDVKSLGGYKVMRESFRDGDRYVRRWKKAVKEDKCWIDTFEI